MNIDDALQNVYLLGIETAPFIYYTERRTGYIEKMQSIFTHIHASRIQVVTSVVTLTETLMKPLKEQDLDLVETYRRMLYSSQEIELAPITVQIADSAANLRARYNLRTPNALHIATAIVTGCDAFLTNDAGFKRVTEISVLVLDELELDPPIT